MVPVVVRLERAGACGCGKVVAAGERAGTTRQPGLVVCLTCVAAFSTDPDERATLEDAAERSEDAVERPEDAAERPEDAVERPEDGVEQAEDAVEQAEDTIEPPPGGAVEQAEGTVEPPPVAGDGSDHPNLPAPVAVVIPADWASPSPITLPTWQRSAGVTVVLPPALAVAPSPAAAAAPLAPPVPARADPAPAVEATTPHTDAVVALDADATDEPAMVAATAEAVAMTVPSHRRRMFLPAGLLALRSSRGREAGSTGQSDAATRAVLDSAVDSGVLALHDRRMPGRRSRIAHLAFGAGGVYVIDVVRANNARVEVLSGDDRDSQPRDLLVGGRPMTGTVVATQGRVAIVRALLDEVELSAIPVIGVMYFVDATVPSCAELEVAGVRVVGRTGLPGLVDSEGTLEVEHRETLREYLTERLPA